MKYLFVLILLTLFLVGCEVSENVSVSKDVPIEVNSGDIFNFTVIIHNEDTIVHKLKSIDISDSFLEGIIIIETTPKPREERNALFGMHEFMFRKDLAEKSATLIIFTAKAIKPGDFSGDLDVCVDEDTSCLWNSIRIIVN